MGAIYERFDAFKQCIMALFANKEVSVLFQLLNDLMINHFKVPLGVLAQLKGRYAFIPNFYSEFGIVYE